MPFDPKIKTPMFIRSSRLCCLCLKQCGTNIEAAHIIDESKGGSNEEENGIPVCLDCHQEIGAYNDKHPKGNKFSAEELRARRDRIYKLVESGAIYAQVIARSIRAGSTPGAVVVVPEEPPTETPSAEGRRFADLLLRDAGVEAPASKLKLLSPRDTAFVLDKLLTESETSERAIHALGELLEAGALSKDNQRLVLESLVRKLSLFGNLSAKIELLKNLSESLLLQIADDLRVAFFEELLTVVKHDQWEQVNKLVPVLTQHIEDIPAGLQADYVMTMLGQSRSSSFSGAPAAASVLKRLPDAIVRSALPELDIKYLLWYGKNKSVRDFVTKYSGLAEGSQQALFDDYLKLSERQFLEKYDTDSHPF